MHGSKSMSPLKPESRSISIRIARDPNDLMLVTAIRAAVYLAEQDCPIEEEFDGNDLVAAHFLGFIGNEPAGCLRVRFFGEFAKVEVGDWGHSLAWPSGTELGADMLWLETLSATGHGDVRAFLEWRLRHALSLSKAAEALGVSRRMVAYYSNGEKRVPKPILLACRGWEVSDGMNQAA